MRPDYIFISGVSRTGSTLLVKIFNRSTEIAILWWENWFLGHQIPSEGVRYAIRHHVGDLSNRSNIPKVVDYIYDGNFKRSQNGYWRWVRRNIERQEFTERLLAAPECSERVIFEAMMQIEGDRQKKKVDREIVDNPILGEKTPPHIYYVPTLLEWFPNSRVVHTFRDPRGIFASELRRRDKQPISFPYKQLSKIGFVFYIYILLQVTYMWLRAAKLHFKYQEAYPDKYYLLKFEDLVSSPDQSLQKLCDFLDIEFQENMLEQKVISHGFKAGQQGFDGDAARRWQEVNPAWVNGWFKLTCGSYLKAFGYA